METYSELKAQIQRQSEAAQVTSDFCQNLEEEVIELRKENQKLKDEFKRIHKD